ncbi:MAG: DNA-methyltransferase [Verrucomicrobiales bacterium]
MREQDFKQICREAGKAIHTRATNSILMAGDSLELLKLIPDNSISLILTDPPYHATQKKNIYGDTQFKQDGCYIEWMTKFAAQWRRILKINGSIFCFCDSSMSARLEVMMSDEFNILSHVVWTKPNEPGYDGWKGKMKKEALRQWYPHSERIIFAEPAKQGNLHRSPFGLYLKEMRTKAGMSTYALTELIGAYGKVNHGGAVSNWEAGRNTPSRDQYSKMCDAIIATGKVSYMIPYEDIIRKFSVDKEKEFTDVWTFPSVKPYKGKHPAEKPLDMLIHAIEATTYEGDIVLDCFAGSGSTAVASIMSGRRSIAMEIDEKWLPVISERIKGTKRNPKSAEKPQMPPPQSESEMLLFEGS